MSPSPITFSILARDPSTRARAGELVTPHGTIPTPAFVGVATLGTLKGVPYALLLQGVPPALIVNTYHLYLRPGAEVVRRAGGIHRFMGWQGSVLSDSGGFQVFSLGAAFGKNLTKVAREDIDAARNERAPAVYDPEVLSQHGRLAIIDDEGVSFTSHLDGSFHRFTPERAIEIQHAIGADIIFAFDECTAATASYAYQREALARTHAWAERSLRAHRRNLEASRMQALFGIVQGGRHEALRRESARTLGAMPFDGYGIGGSYVKEDLDTAVGWVCEELPEDKPRHLLGIGEPEDLLRGIEQGVDLFDCVQPTRLGRTGVVYTREGKLNLWNERFREDFNPVDSHCACPVCASHTRAYLAHLFRAREMAAASYASLHNLFFLQALVAEKREAILRNGRA